jgi:signal transduction histidine kinase
MDERLMGSEPERARRTLSGGALVFRWVAFWWMTILNLTRADPFRRPVLAWLGIAAAGSWTAWLTAVRRDPADREGPHILVFDLVLSASLVVLSALVVPDGKVIGPGLFYATAYPLSTALAWGAAWGVPGALASTGGLGLALLMSRPLNGLPLWTLDRGQLLNMGNGLVNLLLAGGVAGVVARHLDRSAAQLRSATDAAIRARERAARLAEREAMGRAIHDSVLQSLALIHARARELGAKQSIPGREAVRLAEMAGEQEQALRAIIVRPPEEAPTGARSLREALEEVGRSFSRVPVTVSAVGPIWLPAAAVEKLAAAVRQALDNVGAHAEATRAAVFADVEDDWVTVSVRDDGVGFVYDEGRLKAESKAGLLKSMKGRVQELGGRMRVETAPGAGTEVQFRVPVHREEVPP